MSIWEIKMITNPEIGEAWWTDTSNSIPCPGEGEVHQSLEVRGGGKGKMRGAK